MNDILATKCSTVFESVITSPLGEILIESLSQNCPLSNYANCILEVRDWLEDGKYSSPGEFVDDVRRRCYDIARDLGSGSDMSLSLLTILQLIEEGIEPLLQEQRTPDMAELDKMIGELKELAKEMPNDLSAFRVQLAAKGETLPSYPYCFGRQNEFDSKEDLDVAEIYQGITSLENDKDLEKIVDIISRYETSYSHTNDIINIDLNRCHPYTLRLIQKYITSLSSREKDE